MSRTDLVTEIMKLTGHKRSVHPDVTFGIRRLLDEYEKNLKSGQCETVDGGQNYTKAWELLKEARDEADNEGLERVSTGVEILLELINHRCTKHRSSSKIDPEWNFDKVYINVHDGKQFCFYVYWDDEGDLMHYEEY